MGMRVKIRSFRDLKSLLECKRYQAEEVEGTKGEDIIGDNILNNGVVDNAR